MISGGIDSPIAGLLTKKKFELEAIHFSQEPFTDNTPERKSLAAAKKLGIKELTIIEAGELLQHIADSTFREYYFVLMKIFFMKVSEEIAKQKNIDYLVTGEALGQVSSQTLSNLDTINSQVEIEILRPCMFMEKQEIIDISVKEDYFEISKGPEMCDALASSKPKTKTRIEKVKVELKKCDMNNLVKKALDNIRLEQTKNIDIDAVIKDSQNAKVC